MTSIFDSQDVSVEEAAAASRRYTPSVQELAEEAPDEVDNSPVSPEQLERMDEASRPSFVPIINDAQQRDRAPSFVPPSDAWVHPRLRHQQRQQALFPSRRALDDLDQRIAKVMRFDGVPEQVEAAAKAAWEAVAAARQTRVDGAHPDNARYALDAQAKDNAAIASANAVLAVGALERVAEQSADDWLDGLVGQIPVMRERAAKALEEASVAYGEWRQAIAAGDALSREQGRFGEWHTHPDAHELNALGLIGEVRKARDISMSDDPFISGQYLVDDPTPEGEIPAWTMASLEKSARIAPGSFAESVLLRLKSPHPADAPAVETIEERDLRIINTRPIPALNKQQQMWDDHARAVDPAR